MQFLSPYWLYLLILPVLLLGLALYARQRHQGAWRAFVSSDRLASRLVQRISTVPWMVATILISVSASLFIIALAQPTSGRETIDIPSQGRKVYLALDLSRSMLVQDAAPDRLTKAKTVALEIIEAFPDEKIGLISFAGKAWLEAPLTTDHKVLQEAVLALNQNTVPYGGSDSGSILELAVKSLPEDTNAEALLVILSDGEFHDDTSVTAISEARQAGLTIFTIGVGTLEGGLIPDKAQGYFRDRNRRTVHSKLNPQPLEQLAYYGGGQMYLGEDYQFIKRMRASLSQQQSAETTQRELVVHNHLFQAFLIPACLGLILALLLPSVWQARASAALILLCTIGALSELPAQETPPVPIAEPSDRAQPDPDALREKASALRLQADEAQGENKLRYRFAQGVAEYQATDHRDSIKSFSESLLSESPDLQTESHYNLGNANFLEGQSRLEDLGKLKSAEDQLLLRASVIEQWNDSLDHYTGSLHLTPDHPHARENYDYVKQQVEQLQEEQRQQMEQMQQQGQGEPSEEEGESGDGPGRNKDEGHTPEELQKLKEQAQQNGDEDQPQPQGEGDEEERPASSPDHSDLTPEEARELLEESSDMESGNLRTGRQRYSIPSKDW